MIGGLELRLEIVIIAILVLIIVIPTMIIMIDHLKRLIVVGWNHLHIDVPSYVLHVIEMDTFLDFALMVTFSNVD